VPLRLSQPSRVDARQPQKPIFEQRSFELRWADALWRVSNRGSKTENGHPLGTIQTGDARPIVTTEAGESF
jgi:hypothetical protein